MFFLCSNGGGREIYDGTDMGRRDGLDCESVVGKAIEAEV